MSYYHIAQIASGEIVKSRTFTTFEAAKADGLATWDMWDGTRGGEVMPNALDIDAWEAKKRHEYQAGIFTNENRMAAVFSTKPSPDWA